MLEVQKYLQNHSLEQLELDYGIEHTLHPNDGRVILNYSQITSPKTERIVQECRGLCLDRNNGYAIVAKAFNRFYNLGEVKGETDKFIWDNCIGTHKEDGCFSYQTKLNLWNGGTVKIGDVVSKQLTPILIGMNKEGNLVPTEVNNWFNNGTKDNWLDIYTDCDISRDGRTGGYTNRLRITKNHSININGKFQAAILAKLNDIIITYEYQPGPSVVHLINSSLLGDGCVYKNGKNCKFTEGHKLEHKEYIEKIMLWLGECGINVRYRISGFGTQMLDASSKTYKLLNKIRQEWYPEGIKRVPLNLSWIDDFTIAKWYMDDGGLQHSETQEDRADFATHGFIKEDIQRLVDKLNQMYGINAVLQKDDDKWFIRINAGKNVEINNFWQRISPYIIPCMRYKLPIRFRNFEYKEYEIGKEIIVKKSAKIINISRVINNKKNFPNGKCGFDISTTTKNYFAKGILVHNSLTLLYNHNNVWQVNTRGSFATSDVNGMNFTWRDLFMLAFPDQRKLDKLNKNDTYVFELCSPYTQIVRIYPEPILYLLSVFNNEYGYEYNHAVADEYAEILNIRRPDMYQFNDQFDAMAYIAKIAEKDRTFEGLVLRDNNNHRLKIKSDFYLRLHHLSNNNNIASPTRIAELIMQGEKDEVLTYFPCLKSDFEQIEARINVLLKEMDNIWFCFHDVKSQKKFAEEVKNHKLSKILFDARKMEITPTNLLLQKEWQDYIVKIIAQEYKYVNKK